MSKNKSDEEADIIRYYKNCLLRNNKKDYSSYFGSIRKLMINPVNIKIYI
ncbi:hypothetical protein [Clostridium sp.]|nr:hypothetical protein [Clostridium sp.]MDR3594502.1 hypothetical protein [Clostridium sp.]